MDQNDTALTAAMVETAIWRDFALTAARLIRLASSADEATHPHRDQSRQLAALQALRQSVPRRVLAQLPPNDQVALTALADRLSQQALQSMTDVLASKLP